jgi:hypothetical protein
LEERVDEFVNRKGSLDGFFTSFPPTETDERPGFPAWCVDDSLSSIKDVKTLIVSLGDPVEWWSGHVVELMYNLDSMGLTVQSPTVFDMYARQSRLVRALKKRPAPGGPDWGLTGGGVREAVMAAPRISQTTSATIRLLSHGGSFA